MNYPNNIKKVKTANKVITYGNRGMGLESLINESCEYYNEVDRALIYKKPTPIGISEASYNSKGRVIKNGYFKAPSTLDYNGIYKNKYIEFEAKETSNKTSFPLSNFHEHQIKYIPRVLAHGGICFIIMKINNIIYLIKGSDFVSFINNNERKSIPYDWIVKNGFVIKEGYNPALNYLDVVDEVYFKGE